MTDPTTPVTTKDMTMQAITHRSYGTADVVELQDVDTPAVGPADVLVAVRAASLNYADWHRLTGTPYLIRLQSGLRRPERTILGSDAAGIVEAVGSNVARFAPGDAVFGRRAGGMLAEYASVPETQLVHKPANVTFEQAAAVGVAAFTALQGLRDKGHVQPGDRVLIKGASGGVGTFAVQIAKSFGAHVTAVCSTPNVDTVRAIGADEVIDYTRQDLIEGGQRYDVMLDIAGNQSLSECRRLLQRDGIYVLVGGPKGRWLGPIPRLIRALLLSLVVSQTLTSFTSHETAEDLRVLRDLIAAGTVTPVIDRTYERSEAADALRYLGDGHARGKIIVSM